MIDPRPGILFIGGKFTSAADGISTALVVLVNQYGVVRGVLTNAFGYYRFTEIPVGETYTVSVRHKRYQFVNNPQVVTVLDEISALDFTAEP